MPLYCYTTKSGETTEELFPMSSIPDTIRTKSGQTARRDREAEFRGSSTTSADPWTNHASLSLMVHPSQIKNYQQDAKDKGLGTVNFNKEGMPLFRSKAEQRRYNKAYDYVNYGDYY